MNRKLRSLFLTVILDSRFISLKRTLAELRRRLTFKTRVVHVFLQLDDPYSYLLSHYLEVVCYHLEELLAIGRASGEKKLRGDCHGRQG